MAISSSFLLGGSVVAQQVEFQEYKLDNGLHVILH
jgi:zinc protease